ncbi:MAG: hypothetical protein IKQ41_12075 [Clostridia bacterium]|nr:hypothetical protein [Clostridia bacterium]
MSEKKFELNDDMLDQVVGGLFTWNRNSMTMTYSHADGSKTTHRVLDIDKAWERSNILHGQNMNEDKILQDLISKGYIAG